MAVENFSGSGKGAICAPHSFTRVPLLAGFRFDYDEGDHHVLTVGVSPLYDYVNDSLGGDLRKQVCGKHFDNFLPDSFSFVADYHEETRPDVFLGHIEGHCEGGAATFELLDRPSASHVFVLIGFEFGFSQRQGSILFFWRPPFKDHHIGTLSIQPDESQSSVTIQFSDKNNDDSYVWEVWYAWVPDGLIERVDNATGRGAKGNAQAAIASNGIAVIRGFTLTFGTLERPRGEDHHVDEVGVLINHMLEPGDERSNISVFLNDKNDDDTFDWSVNYVVLQAPGTVPPVE